MYINYKIVNAVVLICSPDWSVLLLYYKIRISFSYDGKFAEILCLLYVAQVTLVLYNVLSFINIIRIKITV